MSIHKGTKASKLKPLNSKIIKKRATELMEAHRKTALENKKPFLNQTIKVFVNDKAKISGFYEGRDENYNIILVPSQENILGKTIDVRIKQLAVHHMLGEII
jgi:tRNA A37 methylthiotransferase MiaB